MRNSGADPRGVHPKPEGVIRRYLDEHGDLADVPVEHLLVTWRLEELTEEARSRIERTLTTAGVRVEPPLARVGSDGTVKLSIDRGERRRELEGGRAPRDLATVLVAGGSLAALVSLWLPWVAWLGPLVYNFPFERRANAWDALGLEPWLILVAVLVAAGSLLPSHTVPERWRAAFQPVVIWVGLALGALAAIISLTNAFSPPSSAIYGDAEVRVGPIVALWASCIMTAGIWLSRPRATAAPAPTAPAASPGSPS